MTNKLAKLTSKITNDNFVKKVQEQYVEKYASDVVNILEDQRKLERALEKVTKTLAAVEKGDYTAIDKYKKARQLLEIEEDVEL